MNQIILASASPRRTEILKEFKINHIVIPSQSEELYNPNNEVTKIVEEIACSKTRDLAIQYPNDYVIGADTIVSIDNKILGKPKDEAQAISMLKLLQNRTHQVITGVCISYNNKEYVFHEITDVVFDKMTNDQIKEYIHNDYVYDKAGSYAIQSKYAWFIKEIKGSYYNVMGLPIERLIEELKNKLGLGFEF